MNLQSFFNLNEYFAESIKPEAVDFIKKTISSSQINYGTFHDSNYVNNGDLSVASISHIIREVCIIGSNVIVYYELLNTLEGKIAKSLISDGFSLSIKPNIALNTDGTIMHIRLNLSTEGGNTFREEQLSILLG